MINLRWNEHGETEILDNDDDNGRLLISGSAEISIKIEIFESLVISWTKNCNYIYMYFSTFFVQQWC